MDVEIGRGKKARQAYGFDDVAIVPGRRTRDPEDVDLSWRLGEIELPLPLLASAMDGVVSPRTAIALGKLGGVGVLNLEGLFSRYEDAEARCAEIASLPTDEATARMQELYSAPIEVDLMVARIKEIKAAGVTVAASLTPQRVEQYADAVIGPCRHRSTRRRGNHRWRGTPEGKTEVLR